MQSLTDRMAAVLRELYDREPFDGSRIQEQAREVLVEYEALRAAPAAKPRVQAGSYVRCTRASRKTRDYQEGDEAKVQYLTADGRAVVAWITDLGNNTGIARSTFLRLDHCEVVLNLPATNTGD